MVVTDGEEMEISEINLIETELEEARQKISVISTGVLIDAIDKFSKELLSRANPLHKKYPRHGLPFLGHWCKKENLVGLLDNSLGSIDCLDKYVGFYGGEKRAFPKGIVVHWIAGNVPTLGLLSLISGILTRNANLIRVPTKANNLLDDLLMQFAESGEIQQTIANSVKIIRYDYMEKDLAESISRLADVRIIWGGDESSTAIKSLPTKLTCTDIVFPDRTSFVIVGKPYLSGNKNETITRLIAHDASVFEQKACASPHTVFLDTDEEHEIEKFCEALSIAMQEYLDKIPKITPTQKEVSAILNLRAQYDMFHEAWYSQGTEYTILSDNDVKLGPPIGNRTIYVRRLPTEDKLAAIIPKNIQTVGIAAEGEAFERITRQLGYVGVQRFTPIGAMTTFEIPWDGIDLPQYLIRWTTRRRSN